LEERSAPNALPAIPEAAPLTVEPVPPYPEEGGPAEPPAPSPGATAEMPPAETSEAADAPPLPGAAERRASELLSQVGFGEEPAYLIDESQRPGRRWWKGKVRIQTSKAEARVWIRVLKIFAVILLIGIAIVASIIVARGAVRSVVRLWNERARTGTAAPLGALRFALPAPEQASYLSSPAISPDGSLLAFSAVDASRKRLLWIRPLNSLRATPLADTDDALAPFWSPDGRYLGFFSGKKLKKIAAGGGGPTVLCDTEGLAGGGAWNREGVIVFGRGFYDSLYKVSAAGGTPEPVTRLESSRGERAHLWPRFLPDGKHFLLFTLSERDENNGISIGSLDGKETHHLLVADTNAIYAELNTPASTLKGGYLIFAQGHHLNARPFDPLNLELKGEGFTIADEINYLDFINLLPISASDNGLLAYQNIDTPKRQLVWLDRDGNQIGSIGDPAEYGQARISPDGTHVAVNRLSPANRETADIWIFDVQTNAAKQFTNTSAHEGSPVWSPDGTQIVYFGNPNGPFNLYRKSFVKAGDEELLLSSNEDKYPNDCSPDGKYLLFGSVAASTNSDLLIMAATGARKPSVYLQTVSSEGYAQFSPDGKWIAYQSDESRRAEVYVEPFPRADGKSRRWQISTDGGGLPRWRHDGRELYYIMGNGKMMAVTVTTGSNFTAEAPRQLFQTRALPRTWNLFDVSRDGSRFLVNIPLEWASSSPITVIANWTEGFKAEP
jgi:Tol biopolymer transport system component